MTEMEEIPEFLRRKKDEVREPFVERDLTPKETKLVVKALIDSGETIEVLGPTTIEKIQRGIREAQGELRGELDERFDAFILSGTPFSTFEYLRANDIKPKIAVGLIDAFTPIAEEIQQALIGRDADLKVAYRCYTKAELKSHLGFLQSIIDDTKRWIDTQKAAKGPRKQAKTRIKPENRIKNLKYQREDRELKLVSIPPERIIGAQELWTYNTKYKQLAHYIARGRIGLSVKGTTIQDFDVENSLAKVLRKPEDVLSKVLEKKKKILEGLSTKAIELTGRINENTILLRVG